MPRWIHRTGWSSCIALLCLLAGGPLDAAPPKLEDHVKLKSGRALAGKVIGEAKLDVGRAYRVETDFGEILVPKKATKKVVEDKKPDPNATFSMRRIRVVRFKGVVECKRPGTKTWKRLSWTDKYEGKIVNKPNVFVGPGDTVRTAKDSEVDLMPHKDVWIRIAAHSEVEIPKADPAPKEGSYTLKRGKTIQQVKGKPRGQVFRVRTPLTLLSVKGTFFRVGVASDLETCAVKEGVVAVGVAGDIKAGEARAWTAAGARVATFDADEFEVAMIRFPLDRMSLVPAGTYVLGGGPASGPEAHFRARTHGQAGNSAIYVVAGRHRIPAPFLVDRLETSTREFRDFCQATGARTSRYLRRAGRSGPAGAQPVHGVSQPLASQFAAWAGKTLPTEVQWEAAARGSRALAFPWGATFRKEHETLFYACPGPDFEGAAVALSYGSLPAVTTATLDVSPFGVHAMATSVPEWVQGRLQDPPLGHRRILKNSATHWSTSTATGPTSWILRGAWGQVTARFFMLAETTDGGEPVDRESEHVGFRCASGLDDQPASTRERDR